MSNVKGLPAIIVVPFTPTITFSTTQGTVTYTLQSGTIRYMGADYQSSNASLGTWTALISASVSFTVTGAAGNVSVSGIPLALPSGSGTARAATLSIAIGIDSPANSQGNASSLVTYPSNNPISAQIVYYSKTGALVNVTSANLVGSVTIGIMQFVSTTTPPY